MHEKKHRLIQVYVCNTAIENKLVWPGDFGR